MLYVNEGLGQSFLGSLPGALKQDSSFADCPRCVAPAHTHLFVGESARPDRCLIPTYITHDPVPLPNSQKHDRDRAPRALSGCRPQASERCDEDAL